MDGEVAQRGGALLASGRRFGIEPGALARLFAPGFHKLLDAIDQGLNTGSIRAYLPDGTARVLGGRALGFNADVTIADWRALLRLCTGGSVGWYQAWEAGEWSSPDPVPLFALFMANGEALGETGRSKGPWRVASRLLHRLNRNTRAQAERNIHAHYDLGNDFYAAWLGNSMVYSSALFGVSGSRDLERAQHAKLTAMLERVRADEAQSLLEIGCGWGGLAHLAARSGTRVDAISLSDEQLAYCRSKGGGGQGDPRFLKQDYRDVRGQYDAIVSVEMVEALGREYWPDFMDCVAGNLKPGGRAAIQFISLQEELYDGYAASADFIQAYVFPGGLLIRASEFRRLAEERGLVWTDEAEFGTEYAETLKLWRENFERALADGRLPAGFDGRFVRLWRYYLMYCEGGFRGRGIGLHQVTLLKAAD